MKKLLVILTTALSFSANAQNAGSTKEQNDASQKICERTIETMGTVVGVAGALSGPVGTVAGAAVGAVMISKSDDWCREARDAHEKNTPVRESKAPAQKQPEFVTNKAFTNSHSESSNCTATNVKYTSKARR